MVLSRNAQPADKWDNLRTAFDKCSELLKEENPLAASILHHVAAGILRHTLFIQPRRARSRDYTEGKFLKILMKKPYFICSGRETVRVEDFKNVQLGRLYQRLLCLECLPAEPLLPSDLGSNVDEILAWTEIADLDIEAEVTEELLEVYVRKLTGFSIKGKIDPSELAIKLNNSATNDPCALCGARTDPVVGPELFLADSWEVVCRHCGKEVAPRLIRMLDSNDTFPF